MKRLIPILAIIMLAGVFLPARTMAHELSGSGDIIVDIRDELGHNLNGAKVDLRLPGVDGVLDDGFDTTITHVDGVTVGGTADGDGVAADGDVEYSSSIPSANFSGLIANGQMFRLIVTLPGYVKWTQDYVWNSAAPNIKASDNLFTVKITLHDELGGAVIGGQVAISGGLTAVDGAANDADGAANGLIYVAQDPTAMPSPQPLAFTLNGYLSQNASLPQINENLQTIYTTSFQYPFKITAQDELGGIVPMTSPLTTLIGTGGLTNVAVKDSAGAIYWAATGGPGQISLTFSGFITSQTPGTYSYAAGGAQQTLAFQTVAGQAPALQYSLHVLGVDNELGNALLMTDVTFGASGFTITQRTVNGGTGYVAASAVNGNLTAAVSGYITATQNLTPNAVAMQTVDFDNDARHSVGAAVDGPPVLYAFKTDTIGEELANALTVAGPDTYKIYTDSGCSVEAAYVATPIFDGVTTSYYAAVAAGTYYAGYIKSGFVKRCTVISYTNNATAQLTPAFTTVAAQPLLFAIKVVVSNELNTAVAGMLTTDITIGGGPATRANSNSLYYAIIAAGAMGGIGHAGFIGVNTGVDLQLASVVPGTATQTVITLTGTTACSTGGSVADGESVTCDGLKYGIRVNVSDELGNAISAPASLAVGDIMINGAADAASANALYYKNGSGAMTSSKSGFVNINSAVDTRLASVITGVAAQTVVTLTGTAPCVGANVGAGSTPTCRGLYYAVRVNVSDELATVITPMAVTDITINGGNAAQFNANALYYALAAAGPMAGGKSGYVNVSTAVDTSLALVNPGALAQTTINLTGTVACAGANVGAGATVPCDGLKFAVKFINANSQDELGNALALAGADTTKLFTDAACTTEAAYISAPVISGGAFYKAVAPGSYWAQWSKAGYVTKCDHASVTAAAAGPQANPTFLLANGDGLPFAVKVVVNNELGTAVAGLLNTDLTIGGINAAQISTNNLYYSVIAAGTLSGGHVGFINVDTLVDTELASVTPGVTVQTVVTLTGTTACAGGGSVGAGSSATCNGLDYRIKVNLSDQLGNSLAPVVVGDITIGGVSAVAVSGNSLYYTAAAGALARGRAGFINVNVGTDTRLASVLVTTTTQTVVNMTGAVACGGGASVPAGTTVLCRGLFYSTVVNVSDELANAMNTITVSDITINAINAAYVNANTLYYPLTAAGIMAGGKSGYINVNTAVDTKLASVQPGVAAQTVVTLTGTVPCVGANVAAGATPTCDGLAFTVKLIAANTQTELGGALTPAVADSFKLYTDAACTTEATYIGANLGGLPSFSVNAWYAAVANGTYWAKWKQAGYVEKCDGTAVTAAQAGPVANPNFLLAGTDGLPFAVKVVVNNELGAAVAGMVVGDITIGGGPATTASANSLYYALAAPGAMAGVGHTGFIGVSTLVDTQLASVVPGVTAQTVVTLTGTTACAAGASVGAGATVPCDGLKYGIKINVSDELGNAISAPTLVVADITIGGAADAVSGNSLYYKNGTAAMTSSKTGYVNVSSAVDTQLASVQTGVAAQTVVNLTGTTACVAGANIPAGTPVACRGLLYAVKVTVADELLAPIITMAVTDITINAANAAYANTNTLYYALAAAGPMAGGKSGFININTAVDTRLASVVPGALAQTVVTLSGTGAPCVGANVAAGTTRTCDGLIFTVKHTAAQDELGNPLVLAGAGADTFKLYSDASCTTEAAYVSGPTFSVNAWYTAVANGSYYAKYGKTGYIPKCDHAAVNAAQAGPVVSPTFLLANLDGLPFALKVVVNNELGTAVAGMVIGDVTIGGLGATTASTNNLYYAITVAGAMGGVGHTGFVGVNPAIDTQLASVVPGTTVQTVVTLTGTTACVAGASVAAGSSATCNGLDYGIRVNVSDELGNTISAPTLVVADVNIAGAADAVSGNSLYYKNGTAAMTSSMAGYVNVNNVVDTQIVSVQTGVAAQTVVNLTGTTACTPGAFIPAGTTAACRGLLFAVKVNVSSELATAITPLALTDIKIGAANADRVVSNTLYYAAIAAGALNGSPAGYVNVNAITDTQLATVNPGVTGQTLINLSGTVACVAGASVVQGATANCNGLDYAVKVTVSDELNNALVMTVSSVTIGGNNAVAVGGAGTNVLYYNVSAAGVMAGGKTGFINISTAIDTQLTSVTPGVTAQTAITLTGVPPCNTGGTIGAGATAFCSGLDFNVKLGAAQNEIAGPLALLGTDSFNLYTDPACTIAAVPILAQQFIAGAWYVPVNPGAYYGQIGRAGYVSTCDATPINVTAAGPQFSPSFVAVDGDGLKFDIEVVTVQDELGNVVPLAGTEALSLFSDSLCTVPAAAPLVGPTWYAAGSSWHIAETLGTYYIKIAKTGYVNRCHAAATAVNYTTQAIPTYTMAGGDGLQYGLKVIVFDQYGQAVTQVTTTHGGVPPVFADQGTNHNIYYYNTSVPGQMLLSKAGYQSIDSGGPNVTPGGGAVAQTVINLTGDTNGPLGVVGGGAAALANGLFLQSNIRIYVQRMNNDSTLTPLTGLGSYTNFFFYDGAGRVTPDLFVETDPIGAKGRYEMKVSPTSLNVQVKNVNPSPAVNLEDSPLTSLAGYLAFPPAATLTITLYPKADYIQLATDGTLESAGFETITATIKDSTGATVTVGPNSTRRITFTLAGGSTTPASVKYITATNLSNNTGTGGQSITGELVSGTALFTITDSVVGDGTNIAAYVATATGTLVQSATNSNSINFPVYVAVVAGLASKIVVLNPADTSTDMTAQVTFEVQDSDNNLITTANATTFTAHFSGTARGINATTGTVLSGGNSNNVNVQAAGGKVVLNVKDDTAETVTINLASPSDPLLSVVSTEDIVFSPGAISRVVFDTPAPTPVAGGAGAVITARIRDGSPNSNVVATCTAYFTITAASTSGNAKFIDVTHGAVISGLNTGVITVSAADGYATVKLSDSSAETAALTMASADPILSGKTFGTQNITFTPGTGAKLVYTTISQTQTAGVTSVTAYRVQVQDGFGNPIMNVPSSVTVGLSSNNAASAFFYETPSGSAVASIVISTATDSAIFYYKDTKAGTHSITASGPSLTGASLSVTTNPAAPVTGATITNTAPATDNTQPTHKSVTQTVTGLTDPLIKYPYTDATVTYEIVADGSARGKVTVTVQDAFGNKRSGDTVTLSSLPSGPVFTPGSASSDSTGVALFDVSSAAIGTYTISVSVASATFTGTLSYGNSFQVVFKSDDRTPPVISNSVSTPAASLVNGDLIGSNTPLIIKLAITDPGTNASGVNTNNMSITVMSGSSAVCDASPTPTCPQAPGTTSVIGCTVPSDCQLTWTPSSALPAGEYTVVLHVEDNNRNVQTQKWGVRVSGSNAFQNIAAGAPGDGIFNPLAGGKMAISFQAPSAGAVTLEIYRRDGRLIYTTTSAVTAGYNQLLWDGRGTGGGFVANGIYVFRLRASLTTGVVEQTGKLAIFKK